LLWVWPWEAGASSPDPTDKQQTRQLGTKLSDARSSISGHTEWGAYFRIGFPFAERTCPNAPVTRAFVFKVDACGLVHIDIRELRQRTPLLKAVVDPRVVQERLGHNSIAVTTDIYSSALWSVRDIRSDGRAGGI
jgi:integrase